MDKPGLGSEGRFVMEIPAKRGNPARSGPGGPPGYRRPARPASLIHD